MSLPPCHSRRVIEPEGEVYFCAHPRVHARDNLVTAAVCRICRYWQEPPPADSRNRLALPSATPRGACVYLGDPINLRPCQTCPGSVRLKIFACRHPLHQEATLSACAVCPDFEPRPPEDPVGPGRAA